MKVFRPFGLLLILGLAAAIVIGGFVVRKSRSRSVVLSDGTVTQLKTVTYGKLHTFSTAKPWIEWLRKHVPFIVKYLPAGNGLTSKTSTSNDGLVYWLSHFDPKTAQHFDNLSVVTVDEHGCKFLANSAGGASNGKLYLHHSTAEAFPRRESVFRMNVRAGPERQASFEIKNPAHGPFPKWTPEELPATRSDGDLEITLNSLRYYSDPYPQLSSDFAVRRNGLLTREWQNQSMRLTDATGNAAWNLLCTNEPAWKILAKFYRVASASFDEKEIWRLPKGRIPTDGEGISINRSNDLNGVQITVLVFAGPGTHSISNNVFLSSEAAVAGEQWNANRLSSKTGFYTTARFAHAAPLLLARVSGLTGDDRLLLRARDAMGKIVVADEHASNSGLRAWRFHKAAAGEEVEIEFVLNKPRSAEFVVKPPMLEARTR